MRDKNVSSPPIRFLIYPAQGEVREHVRAEFFGRALSQRVGRPIVVEMARTYEAIEQELAADRVDIVWATAEQCNAFESKARAILRAVRAGRYHYHAALICRAQEPLTLKQLQGTRAAWVAPMSTGGHLLAIRHLEAQGLIPAEVFAEQRFVGSYRNALLAVAEGTSDMASLFTTHPDEYTVRARLAERVGVAARQLTAFAFTEPTLADGLILTSRLSEEDCAAIVSALTTMTQDGSGLDPLLGSFNIEGFALATSSRSPAQPFSPIQRTEFLAAEVDAEERCSKLWSFTGLAFGQEVSGREGLSLEEALPPEASALLGALVRATRHSGVGGRVEYRLESGGESRLYAAEAAPRGARSGGTSPRTTLLVRDITEQQALEVDLYRLASFPLLHPEPMMELSLNGALHYANPAASHAFPDLQALGASHPLVETTLEWVRRGKPGESPPLVHLAGRYWELMVSVLQETGTLRLFVKDVTSRKQIEARLLHADRMAALGSLASRVGHEMNNPLAFLMANLSFAREEISRLRESLRSDPVPTRLEDLNEVMDALGESLDGAERLKTIIQDLRTLAREPPTHRARVDLHPVLEDALKLVRNELRHRGRLEKDFQPVPTVEADEARLGQVFLNLMINAVQAMSEQDAQRNVLRVSTRTGPAGEAIVEVQDTGAGMTPEVLSRLFEPFFTTRSNSAGMGLSVSHAIVTSLGGTLRAESELGTGTLFTVTLPAT
ncbi:PhnD/SsuA/transferrin family substrate-binding protein [Stigmatella sp. ncwal1]|uniref:histidine kinase n=1 Tax=Stigmatella ashevillensis TaxID=2995309 RepID=A0ABT5D588_9BACT|nr:PhnD/SsuA/transferrin family substrate-binding protein [Stigmatella ashevillena]MDC0708245.1 PhnD/SsuA/transferrin family substrate-binding protein [Stigmatella ashevillena]